MGLLGEDPRRHGAQRVADDDRRPADHVERGGGVADVVVDEVARSPVGVAVAPEVERPDLVAVPEEVDRLLPRVAAARQAVQQEHGRIGLGRRARTRPA